MRAGARGSSSAASSAAPGRATSSKKPLAARDSAHVAIARRLAIRLPHHLDDFVDEIHDPVLRDGRGCVDGGLAETVLLQRGVCDLDHEEGRARVRGLVVVGCARNDRDVRLGDRAREHERELPPDVPPVSDCLADRPVRPSHACGMRRVLRRHRDHHPFEQLHAVVGAEHAVLAEAEIVQDGHARGFARDRRGESSHRSGLPLRWPDGLKVPWEPRPTSGRTRRERTALPVGVRQRSGAYRPVISGRSAYVRMPGGAACTVGIAATTGIAVIVLKRSR